MERIVPEIVATAITLERTVLTVVGGAITIDAALLK